MPRLKADSHEVCLMCGDPVVRTFDGAYLMILLKTKTLMTEWKRKYANTCKFQVRCVTMDNYKYDNLQAPMWVDWCGIHVWTHLSKKKYFRNWMFGQDLNIIGERGQGNQGVIKGYSPIWPQTHTFPRVGEKYNKKGHKDYWPRKVVRPTCAQYPYEMWIDRTNNVISFRSHKNCCGWAVDFWPRGRDTCVNIYAQNGNPTVEMFKTGAKRTDGICGNMDGNIANDWRKCSSKAKVTPNTVASLTAIGKSCRDYTHSAGNYIGGTKLNKTASEAGFK